MKNNNLWTSVAVLKTTRKRLTKHGMKGDKFDDIIVKLLDFKELVK